MAGQGMEEPHPRVRGAAEEDRAASRCHRRDRRERAHQRQGGIGEQQDQGHREDCLRLPQPGQSLRHGHAQMLQAGGAAAGQVIEDPRIATKPPLISDLVHNRSIRGKRNNPACV